jgi:hypothetical protein
MLATDAMRQMIEERIIFLPNVGRQRPRNEGTPDALASEVPECSGSLHDIVRIFGLFSMGVELGFRLLPVLAAGDPSATSR